MERKRFKEKIQQIIDAQAVAERSVVLAEDKYEAIRCHLRNLEVKVDPHFKFWVKNKKFQVMDLPGLGLNNVIVVPAFRAKAQIDCANKFLRVVHAGQMFEIIENIHDEELKHSGYKKVLERIKKQYFGIPRSIIQEYCRCCPVCQLNQPQTTKAPLRPIVHKDFLERIQIDLIDMRHSPDGDYNYIGHFEDHFTKFHVLFPLKKKTATEVAMMIEERVLAYFGPPRIFHSDNGREFVNQLIRALFQRWGGDTTFVTGKPRHSQSQGLVERGNQIIEKKIAAMKQNENISEDETGYPWSCWLPRIMFSLNSQTQTTIGDVPYHLVFGRSVPGALFPGAQVHCVEEESIEGKY